MKKRPLEDRAAHGLMTRRNFLHRLGVAGGSALVFEAMNAWELGGQSAGVRPELTGLPRQNRVIVLGGGMAGLTTAFELRRRGYDVRLLEARTRVGGLNWTVRGGTEETEIDGERQVCRFDEGHYLNAAPWRIPHSHTGLLGYCRELGVPLEVFINENESGYLYHEGEQFGPLAGKRIRLREAKADMRGYTAELLAKATSQDALDLPLSADDKERLVTYLVNEGYLDSADHAYRGTTAGGFSVASGLGPGDQKDPHDFLALLRSGHGNHFRSINAFQQQATMFQPVGGMDQIPMAFHRAMRDQITLGAEVRQIRKTDNGVRVVYSERGGPEQEVTGDYCVCSIPLHILSRIDSDLSPDMAAAISQVSYGPNAKIALQMRRRFWELDDQIYGGHSNTNLPTGSLSYPSHGFHGEKGVLLAFYGGGPTGMQLSTLPFQERYEWALTHASKLHPQMREAYESGFAVNWNRIKYNDGGLPGWSPAARQAAFPRLHEPDGRIYIALAAATFNAGWQEGAIASAWNTVEQLHQRAMTDV